MKIKNQLLLTALFLNYFIFSACSNKKLDNTDKESPFGITSNTQAQILRPCLWSFTVEQSVNGEAVLVSTAKLDSGWHLYSQHLSDHIATKFTYENSDAYQLLGNTEEGDPSKKYDPYLRWRFSILKRKQYLNKKLKC